MTKYRADGLTYKIGAHGFVYKWLHGAWVKSSKSSSDLKRAQVI